MTTHKKRSAETAVSRTARLLSLVSYLNVQGSASISELAKYFNVSESQILSDINLLWVTGTPGYMADDLIDFDAFALDEGIVRLTAARGLGAPLRLGTKESVALLAALNALRSSVGSDSEDSQLIEGLITKLGFSLGENSEALNIQLTDDESGLKLGQIRSAVGAQVPVHITYTNASGESTSRIVEPWSVFTQQGSLYLTGYCRTAQADRVFKLDRISSLATISEEHFTQPVNARVMSAKVPVSGQAATLRLHPAGRWLAEEIPFTSCTESPTGQLTLEIDIADAHWFVALLLAHSDVIVDVEPVIYLREARSQAEEALRQYAENSIYFKEGA